MKKSYSNSFFGYLVFSINKSAYAVPASSVDSIADNYQLQNIKTANKNINGFLNVRGILVPVMNWSTIPCLNKKTNRNSYCHFIIVQYFQNKENTKIALPVDECYGIITSPDYIKNNNVLVTKEKIKVSIINIQNERENHISILEELSLGVRNLVLS